jgi:predicted Rossmann-fold nucleotide-binding protein
MGVGMGSYTLLICGGRDFHDRSMFNKAMAALVSARGLPAKIIHGGATGADSMGASIATKMSIPAVAVTPDWSLGKRAGPIRNQKMLTEYKPDLVLAFPGGGGTADMVARARKAGVEVIEIGNGGSGDLHTLHCLP